LHFIAVKIRWIADICRYIKITDESKITITVFCGLWPLPGAELPGKDCNQLRNNRSKAL
jgi:hypothetical protein